MVECAPANVYASSSGFQLWLLYNRVHTYITYSQRHAILVYCHT